MPVHFHKEDVSFRLRHRKKSEAWVRRVIVSEKRKTGALNFIFCSDKYLLLMNQRHLKHDYYTDVITFDFSNGEAAVSGDIFISTERVADNAVKNNSTFHDELHRVMIHGVLHLLGYNDKSAQDKKKMRHLENLWMEKFPKAG